MLAIISDIHSNVEALSAVLADIDQRGVKKILCLGDVIGYGPQPGPCLDMVIERCAVSLMGNHDYAVLYEPSQFNMGAEAACYWTRQQLEEEPDQAKRASRWDFLGQLPIKHVLTEDGGPEIALVHGSPRRPVNEYIFPDDVFSSPAKLQGLFDRFEGMCFVGHTHVPGIFTDTPDFYSPQEVDNEFELPQGHKAIINVGSVGQPRDRDPRAAYVLVEGNLVQFVRVPYDVESVVEKLQAIKELDAYLDRRLREGR